MAAKSLYRSIYHAEREQGVPIRAWWQIPFPKAEEDLGVPRRGENTSEVTDSRYKNQIGREKKFCLSVCLSR